MVLFNADTSIDVVILKYIISLKKWVLEFPGGSSGEGSGIVTFVVWFRILAQELLHALAKKKKKKKKEFDMSCNEDFSKTIFILVF